MSSSDPRDSMFEFDSPRNSKGLSGKIVLSAIVVLLFVVILIICLYLDLNAHSYLLRARRRHNTRRSPHRRTTQLVFYVDPSNPNAAAAANVSSRGLDEKVLKSLPLFVYSAETHPDLIECAVCLSEFEENETGRVLPNCKHSFHVECIDMWFHSHSTCPLCRSPVDAPVPKNAAVKTGPSSVESASSSAELCTTCQHEEEVGGGGAASTSSFGRPRKPVELMGVTVEVPPKE